MSETTTRNEEIIRQMAEADFEDWRWQNGEDDDAMERSQPLTGFQNFMSGYSLVLFRDSFTRRGGILKDESEIEVWRDKLLEVADDVFDEAA